MNGDIVNTWIWSIPRSTMWQTVEMLDNGDLLVACLYCGLFRIDWDSNLIFSTKRWSFHHDIEVLPDDTLLILSRDFHKYRGKDVSFDSILNLTEGGDLISRWSTFENIDNIRKFHKPSLLDSKELITNDTRDLYRHFLISKFNSEEIRFLDYYHADTVRIIPETPLGQEDKRFQPGNWLVSFRIVDLVVIIDKDTKKIVWSWGPGNVDVLSSPSVLDNGHILIFDSRGNYGYSKVIELDPVTREIVWEYKGDPPETFFSISGGYAQRLANGNTLISESARGRVFEITNEGRIVWEWLNPEKDEQTGQSKSFYRMKRVDRDLVMKLLKKYSLSN
jgi:outer membrane protein assembly factor BamB